MSRVVNGIFKRLLESAATRGNSQRQQLRSFMQDLKDDAMGLIAADRVAGRPPVETLDLTTTRFFLNSPDHLRRLVVLIQDSVPQVTIQVGPRRLLIHVAVNQLLTALNTSQASF